MARPARTNAEWFMHPAAFRNDRRVKAIRARYGAAGYGLLTMLLELLTDADSTQLYLDEVEIELLAGDLGSTPEEVGGLVALAEKVGLFARNEAGCLRCPQLDEWLAPVFDKRNRARNAAEAAKLPQAAAETGVSVTETPQSRVEKSRVDNTSSLRSEGAAVAAPQPEKKEGGEYSSYGKSTPDNPGPDASHTEGGAADVGTSVVPTPPPKLRATRGGQFEKPTRQQLVDYLAALPTAPPNPAALADRFLNHYDGVGWKIGRNPMKDWQATARNWASDNRPASGLSPTRHAPTQQSTGSRYNTSARGGFGGFAGPAPGGRANQSIGGAGAGNPVGGPPNATG